MNTAPNCSLTWDLFVTTKLPTVSIFQDPVYSTYVPKEIFLDMYGQVLRTFTGEDDMDFIDFYFEPSPLNNGIYLFRNEDTKLDFREFAVELGLIPDITEIMEGESKLEKAARNMPKKTHKISKPVMPFENKMQHRTKQAQATLDKLMQRLKEETNPIMRANIEKKISSTLKHIDTSV